jgi:DNA-directed RNA polymerase specialized sigma24 family protein
VKALGSLDGFQAGSSLKSWMFTIMRNTLCTKFKIAKREAPGTTDCVARVSSVEPLQNVAVEMSELGKALDRLPKSQRELLIDITLGVRATRRPSL